MMNTKKNHRFGGAIGIVIAIVVLIGIVAGGLLGYTYTTGKELQEKQTALWDEAFVLFAQKQPEAAYLKLVEIRSTFSDSLDFYRELATGTYLTKEEVNEAIVLICQSEAYDRLFNLESASNWIEKAKLEVNNIENNETKLDMSGFVLRAESADKFCAMYREYSKDSNLDEEKYKNLVKDSIKVGNEALNSSDYDYTVFEIRFLIACGKTFDEPVLISEARSQLFDITHTFGEDEKTKILWSLLRS